MNEQDAIRMFHAMWENFPTPRAADSQGPHRARGQRGRPSEGLTTGVRCVDQPPREGHRGCLANLALREHRGRFRFADDGTVMFWAPLEGFDDLYVHGSLHKDPSESAGRGKFAGTGRAVAGHAAFRGTFRFRLRAGSEPNLQGGSRRMTNRRGPAVQRPARFAEPGTLDANHRPTPPERAKPRRNAPRPARTYQNRRRRWSGSPRQRVLSSVGHRSPAPSAALLKNPTFEAGTLIAPAGARQASPEHTKIAAGTGPAPRGSAFCPALRTNCQRLRRRS